ncbi:MULTISPECIES: hypothetical protein [unclassified Streptomyces]|uniref:hypothetical protein n=1 Tax=unclassified Streptomyces TaxID=2593676 RepID=UPI00332FC5BB
MTAKIMTGKALAVGILGLAALLGSAGGASADDYGYRVKTVTGYGVGQTEAKAYDAARADAFKKCPGGGITDLHRVSGGNTGYLSYGVYVQATCHYLK